MYWSLLCQNYVFIQNIIDSWSWWLWSLSACLTITAFHPWASGITLHSVFPWKCFSKTVHFSITKAGFFTLIIQSDLCICKLNVTRISWFVIFTYLHEFPNGDIGKFFKNLLGWQKINISFSIVAHPADLREGEKDGKFPLCQAGLDCRCVQGAALKKILIFKEWRDSSFCIKAMLKGKTVTISH